MSLGISAVILYWAGGILKESTRILLEMAPKGLDTDTINEDLQKNFPEIAEVLHTHVWTIIPDMLVYSAHIKIDINKIVNNQEEFFSKINDFLKQNHNIIESTIQKLHKDAIGACNF